MERNVLITADSTCDLPAELKKKYNISTYPLHIILGRTSYDDGVNITPDEIYKHFKASGTLQKLQLSMFRSILMDFHHL